MTNSNIITRTCVAIVIVLSILLAGGAPSDPSTMSMGTENVQMQTGSE
ncbi:MAG: hypothetical protein AAGF95_32870 [Chloroflexota bacterium]